MDHISDFVSLHPGRRPGPTGKAFLRTIALVRHVAEPNRLEPCGQQIRPRKFNGSAGKGIRKLLEQLEQIARIAGLALAPFAPSRCARLNKSGILRGRLNSPSPFSNLAGVLSNLQLMQENRDLRSNRLCPSAEHAPPVRARARATHAPSLPLLAFPSCLPTLENVEDCSPASLKRWQTRPA